jgi:hypothetical protein
MKKKAHSESQMVSAVKELESGLSADSVARGHGILNILDHTGPPFWRILGHRSGAYRATL